ncbi:hypothetical protein [Candidatus Binatus soli]|jgi:uncharacterized membrane protein|uniref:hypothetical protein n=1 Tax=Candidatus Binatus soli TaxID=1953413 RepID=UPI003D1064F9
MSTATHMNAATHVSDATHAKEGRTFFIVINILIGVGVLMTAAAMGVLVLAAVSG